MEGVRGREKEWRGRDCICNDSVPGFHRCASPHPGEPASHPPKGSPLRFLAVPGILGCLLHVCSQEPATNPSQVCVAWCVVASCGQFLTVWEWRWLTAQLTQDHIWELSSVDFVFTKVLCLPTHVLLKLNSVFKMLFQFFVLYRPVYKKLEH